MPPASPARLDATKLRLFQTEINLGDVDARLDDSGIDPSILMDIRDQTRLKPERRLLCHRQLARAASWDRARPTAGRPARLSVRRPKRSRDAQTEGAVDRVYLPQPVVASPAFCPLVVAPPN